MLPATPQLRDFSNETNPEEIFKLITHNFKAIQDYITRLRDGFIISAREALSPREGVLVCTNAFLGANRTTTSTTFANVTGMSFSTPRGYIWSFEMFVFGGCDNTGGGQLSITVPAGATLTVNFFGNDNAANTFNQGIITTSGAAGPVLWTANASGRMAIVQGTVSVGSTIPGDVQLQFKSVVAGQTTTVFGGSYVTARRIA